MSSPPPSPPSEVASTYTSSPTLTREYIEIHHSLGTSLMEQNPRAPPTALDLFARNRSYQVNLAERMGYWYSDPRRSLEGAKKGKKDIRTEAQKAEEEVAERKAWRDRILGDIRGLWDRVGKHPGDAKAVGAKETDDLKWRFFAVVRERLEGLEEQGAGVGLAEFQMVVREVLEELGLKLKVEGFVVMKEMATEKREPKNKE